MEDAYMIRKDGKLFPVIYHHYLPQEDIFRSLEGAEWLYYSTLYDKALQFLCKFVVWFIKYRLNINSWDYNKIFSEFKSLYFPVSEEFLKINKQKIQKEFDFVVDDVLLYLNPLRVIMNENFIRERIGGMYETNYGNKDCYFRISSIGFNWYFIIKDFVVQNSSEIDTVSIVRDYSSTGDKDIFYSGVNGEYKFMPVDKFLILNESDLSYI